MPDQAAELRSLVRQWSAGQVRAYPAPPRIVVAGGKGGVGTSTVAVGVSAALVREGIRVVLVDADQQGPDATLYCGLDTHEGIHDVLQGRRSIHEVLRSGREGVLVLPGVRPTAVPAECSGIMQGRLMQQLLAIGQYADIIVIDAGNGLSAAQRRYWMAADQVLLATTADSAAIMDAYAAMKVFLGDGVTVPVALVGNAMSSAEKADDVYRRLAHAAHRFLGINLGNAGMVERFDDNWETMVSDGDASWTDRDGLAARFHPIAAHLRNLLERRMNPSGSRREAVVA